MPVQFTPGISSFAIFNLSVVFLHPKKKTEIESVEIRSIDDIQSHCPLNKFETFFISALLMFTFVFL